MKNIFKRIWLLENPYKFKKGDVVTYNNSHGKHYAIIINRKTKNKKKIYTILNSLEQEEFEENLSDAYYNYAFGIEDKILLSEITRDSVYFLNEDVIDYIEKREKIKYKSLTHTEKFKLLKRLKREKKIKVKIVIKK